MVVTEARAKRREERVRAERACSDDGGTLGQLGDLAAMHLEIDAAQDLEIVEVLMQAVDANDSLFL